MNRRTRKTIFIISLCLLGFICLTGCSKIFGKKGQGENSTDLSEQDLNAQREARFGEAGIPFAEGEGAFRDIRFDYNSASISDTGMQNIESNATILRDNSDVRVQLEGHCDERGTAEYNLALGAERARAVKEVLVSLGISSSRLDTVSYGEEVPLESGHDESAWAKNRRAHFSGFREKVTQ